MFGRDAQEGYQHFIHVQLYIAPVPETGFGEDDTATVGPINLYVTKFGKLRAHASVGPIYFGYLN